MRTTSPVAHETVTASGTDEHPANRVQRCWMAIRDDGRGWLLVVFGPQVEQPTRHTLRAVPAPAGPTGSVPVRSDRSTTSNPGSPFPRVGALTPREHEVLELLAGGATNGAIAARLFISPRTASVHVSRILAKLGAATRTEAAAIAYAAGAVRVPDAADAGGDWWRGATGAAASAGS